MRHTPHRAAQSASAVQPLAGFQALPMRQYDLKNLNAAYGAAIAVLLWLAMAPKAFLVSVEKVFNTVSFLIFDRLS